MKYNYVVFGSDADYYKYGYSQLNMCENTVYYSSPQFGGGIKGYLLSKLRKLHMTPRINKHISLPLKSIWNRFLFENPFKNTNPICFVFFSSGTFTEHINSGFLEYLSMKYPGSKKVVFYQDLIDLSNRSIPLEKFRRCMDCIISFDYADCSKYNLVYHPLVYSDISDSIVPYREKSDIYFCGAAKNRLDKILEVYEWFLSQGMKCDFHIISKNKEDIKKCEKYSGIFIHKSFPYKDNLKHLASSKYLLEIMQKGGTGHTIRACEAIIFNKKLISNNKFLLNADFYNKDDIYIFDNVEELGELKFESTCHLKKYKKSISPIEFMIFIEKQLC